MEPLMQCSKELYCAASQAEGPRIHMILWYHGIIQAISNRERTTLSQFLNKLKLKKSNDQIHKKIKLLKQFPQFFSLVKINNSKDYYIYFRSLKKLCKHYNVKNEIGVSVQMRSLPKTLKEFRDSCLIPTVAESNYVVDKNSKQLAGRSHIKIASDLSLSQVKIKKWSANRQNKIHRREVVLVTTDRKHAMNCRQNYNLNNKANLTYVTYENTTNPTVAKFITENNLQNVGTKKKKIFILNKRLPNYYLSTYHDLSFYYFSDQPTKKASQQNRINRIIGPDQKIQTTLQSPNKLYQLVNPVRKCHLNSINNLFKKYRKGTLIKNII